MKSYALVCVALFVASPAFASKPAPKGKLVADCRDVESGYNVQVFQTGEKGGSPTYRADDLTAKTQIKKVETLFADSGSLVWTASVEENSSFLLSVNRGNVNEQGADAILMTDGFEGHVRCTLALAAN